MTRRYRKMRATHNTMESNLRQTLVYSSLVDSVWINLFDVRRGAGILRATVHDDCLRGMLPSGCHVNQLEVYYMSEGVPYHPKQTIGKRITEHIASFPPCVLDLLQPLAELPVCEDRIHFLVELPDHAPRSDGSSELTSAEEDDRLGEGQDGNHSDSSQDGEVGETPPITELACQLPVELFCESMARFIASLDNPPPNSQLLEHTTSALRHALSSPDSFYNSNVDMKNQSQLLSLMVKMIDPQVEGITVSSTYCDSLYASLSCGVEDRMLPAPESMPLVFVSVDIDRDATNHPVSDIDHNFRSTMHKFYKEWSKDSMSKRVQECCPCPIFGVTLVGTCLRVYGSLFAEKWKSQLLMEPYDLVHSGSPETLERIVHALHGALAHLRDYYRYVLQYAAPKPSWRRLCPFPSAFIDPSGTRVCFSRDDALDKPNVHVWHAGAVEPARGQLVVKYTPRYGQEAHRLLAENNYAPKLLYCGSPYAAHKDCAGFKDILMVVMEWCGHETSDFRYGLRGGGSFVDAIYAAMKLLHEHKMVHGDPRGQNVFQHYSNGMVRIIDFDWAGKEGEARYPDDLSPKLRCSGAKPGGLVVASHDEFWLNTYFPLPR